MMSLVTNSAVASGLTPSVAAAFRADDFPYVVPTQTSSRAKLAADSSSEKFLVPSTDRSAGRYGWPRRRERSASRNQSKRSRRDDRNAAGTPPPVPSQASTRTTRSVGPRPWTRSSSGASPAARGGETPPNAPEQPNAGFAAGEADPAKYPGDRGSAVSAPGRTNLEPIERGCFAEGQEAEPKAVDPDPRASGRGSATRHRPGRTGRTTTRRRTAARVARHRATGRPRLLSLR